MGRKAAIAALLDRALEGGRSVELWLRLNGGRRTVYIRDRQGKGQNVKKWGERAAMLWRGG